MSQENVEAFKRFTAAQNRRDFAAMLDELDPEVEWHSAIMGSLSGEATVFRGRDGVREMLRDLYEAFGEFKVEYNKLIARRLEISEKTVKAHLTRIFERIGVSDRTQAALWVQRHRQGVGG
jgi:hypothetical protein